MSWHLGPMALFDVESTGVDPHRDRIVTASIVEVTPGQEKPYRASTWLLDPTAALLALVDELRETRRAVESLARPLSTPSAPCSGCGSPTHDGDGICPACAVSRRAS